MGTSEGERRVEMASGDSMTTLSGLTKETLYTVEVAAETSGGTGVYNKPLTIQTPDSEYVFECGKVHALCYSTSSTNIGLSLNGEVIPNHGYVEISNIGSSDSTALLCHTNRSVSPGHSNSGGDWFAPDGTKVESFHSTDVPGFVRTRGPMLVRIRKTRGDPDEGIYWCDVNDATETPQTVYVGLYNTGRGIHTHIIQPFYCSLHKLSQVKIQYQLLIEPLTSIKIIPSSPLSVSPLVDLLPLSLGPETPQPLSLKELRLC